MKINIIKSEERGKTELPWLESYHSFSFGNYYDPLRTNFGKLTVFNDDIINGGRGFGMHPHNNAEVVSIALKGKLKHVDSKGNEDIIKEGDIQRMSAGKGIFHSEFNASVKDKAHFLQIWIEPRELDLEPSYESRNFLRLLKKNKFVKVVSGNKENKFVYINQDASFSIAGIDNGKKVMYESSKGKGLYVFIIKGKVKIEDKELNERDSAEITEVDSIKIKAEENSRVLIIEVPM